MNKEDIQEFNEWKESDNVFRGVSGKYYTQCTLYKKGFSLIGLKQYFKKEYTNN